jgi:chromosome segregation ATPase
MKITVPKPLEKWTDEDQASFKKAVKEAAAKATKMVESKGMGTAYQALREELREAKACAKLLHKQYMNIQEECEEWREGHEVLEGEIRELKRTNQRMGKRIEYDKDRIDKFVEYSKEMQLKLHLAKRYRPAYDGVCAEEIYWAELYIFLYRQEASG